MTDLRSAVVRLLNEVHDLRLEGGSQSLRTALADVRAALAQRRPTPVPVSEGGTGSSIEDVGPLIAWLTEQACQAADANQPTDAGMLTWAAQVIGERVDEDAPAQPACGEGAAMSWQPIDTAPKDGTEILASDYDAIQIVSWGEPLFNLIPGDCVQIARRARTALAQPAPPAEGEVGELVALIRQIALAWEPDACLLGNMTAGQLARAADLLEQRHPAPVPVSERLPDASDPGECRMPDGDCWWFDPHADGAWYFDTYQGNYTHWLPAHALPLPAGEGE